MNMFALFIVGFLLGGTSFYAMKEVTTTPDCQQVAMNNKLKLAEAGYLQRRTHLVGDFMVIIDYTKGREHLMDIFSPLASEPLPPEFRAETIGECMLDGVAYRNDRASVQMLAEKTE